MKSGKLPWALHFAIFASLLLLVEHGQPVGNYFENSRFFLAYMFLPAIGLVLLVTVLQKWVSLDGLLAVNTVALSTGFMIFGALNLDFNIINADNVLYIIGYEMIYNRYLFGALIALSFGGFYLASCQHVSQSRFDGTTQLTPAWKNIYQESLLGLGLLIGFLLIVDFSYLGFYSLLVGLLAGISLLHFFLGREDDPRTTQEITRERGIGQKDQPRTLKDHFSVMIFGEFVFSFAIMFLWPMEMIRYGVDGESYWFLNTPTLFLSEVTIGLLIFAAILIVVNFLVQGRAGKFLQYSKEWILFLGIVILVAGEFLYLNLGISFLWIGITRILTPSIFLLLFWWIWVVFQKRNASPTPALGGLFVFGGLGAWASMMLTNDPDSSFSSLIIGILLLVSTLCMIVYLVICKKGEGDRTLSSENVEEVQERDLSQNSTSPAPSPKHFHLSPVPPMRLREISQKISKASTPVKVLALLILTLIPTSILLVNSNSPQNFQILANLNNKGIVYLADPTTKIDQNYLPNLGLSGYRDVDPQIQITAAKNEWEAVQVVLRPLNQNHMIFSGFSFGGFGLISDPATPLIPVSDSNFQAFQVNYIGGLNDIVADQLEILSSLVINDGKNHPLWFNFYVPPGTPAGEYIGTLTLTIGNSTDPNEGMYGFSDIKLTIRLTVYDFRLPEIPSLKSNFGFSTSREEFPRVIAMYDDHRMMHWSFVHFPSITLKNDGTIDYINYTQFDAEVEEIYEYGTYTIGIHQHPVNTLPIDDFFVNGIRYGRANYSLAPEYNATFRQFFTLFEAHVKFKTYVDDFNVEHRWYDDLYFNGDDEIDARGEEVIASSLAKYRWLKSVNMTLPIMQTSGYNQRILDEVDIWCQHGTGEHTPEFAQWQAQGKDMWLYTTRGPRFPNPSLSTSGFSIQSRAIAWQCFVFNYTNYLIWDIATPYTGSYGYGYQGWNGGTIMYEVNGELIPSTRMELTREGFEDYDYFALLARTLEQMRNDESTSSPAYQEGMELLARIQNLFVYGYNTIMDYTEFNSLRADLGMFLGTHSILK